MHVLSNGPQLGSCNLQTQAPGRRLLDFLKATHWAAHPAPRTGSAASGEVPGAPTSITPSAQGVPPSPSPSHSAELTLKHRLNFKHVKERCGQCKPH